MRWSPRTYSVFDFVLQRSAQDSTGTGVATINTSLGAIWTHRWKEFISARALLSHLNSDFRGVSSHRSPHHDERGRLLRCAHLAAVRAEYTHQRRGSTDSNFEFSRDVLLFTVGATL